VSCAPLDGSTQPNVCKAARLTSAVNSEQPLFGNWTFHELGLWLAAGFAIVASVVALILIFLHATHYSKPWVQKQYAPRSLTL
jgi:hypothetical protein